MRPAPRGFKSAPSPADGRSMARRLLPLVYLAGTVAFLALTGWPQHLRTRRLLDEQRGIIKDVERLRRQNAELERLADELANNPQAIERELRRRLFLRRPDETTLMGRLRRPISGQ